MFAKKSTVRANTVSDGWDNSHVEELVKAFIAMGKKTMLDWCLPGIGHRSDLSAPGLSYLVDSYTRMSWRL